MTSRSIKDVLDEHFNTVKFNKELAEKIYRFQIGFINKNEQHLAFFGGNLIGVHTVRFTPKDESIYYYEVLNIDPSVIYDDLDDVKAVNKNFNVSSDVFNIISVYIIYRFLNSVYLSDKQKEFGAHQAALIQYYRILTGRLAHYFKYPLDEESAKQVYANLSYKFLIKKLGSWQAYLNYRATELLNPKLSHRKTLEKFNDDIAIIKMINDIHGRINEMIQPIYREMIKVKNEQMRVYSNSSIDIDTDGVEIHRDKIHGLNNYISYITNIIPDKQTFIKPELIGIILKIMPTAQEHVFLNLLNKLSELITDKKHDYINDLVSMTIVHSYNYLKTDSTVLKNTHDLPGFLSRLRGAYLSSRSENEELINLRKLGKKFVVEITKSNNEAAISANRTSLFLYLCLRTYTKHYYSSYTKK